MMKVFVALAVVLAGAATGAVLLDGIAAVVNDKVITVSKVEARAADQIAALSERYSGEELARRIEQAKRQALSELIDEALLIEEAKRRQIEPKAAAVEERIASYREQFATEEEFIRALESQGLSMNRFREMVKEAVMMEELVRTEIRTSLTVELGEVERYYASHVAEFSTPDRYWLSRLLVREEQGGEGGPAVSAEEFARRVSERVRAGEPLEAIAQEPPPPGLSVTWSELGEFAVSDMSLEIQQAVAGLGEGDLSEPFRMGEGWALLRVDRIEPGYTPPLSEIRDEVKRRLVDEKVAAKKEEWFSKLRESAYIEVRL